MYQILKLSSCRLLKAPLNIIPMGKYANKALAFLSPTMSANIKAAALVLIVFFWGFSVHPVTANTQKDVDNNQQGVVSDNVDYQSWTTAELLTSAENYRSTNIKLSQTLLDILELRALDSSEQAQYEFLRAYHLILIGNYQASLKAFIEQSKHNDVNVRLQAFSYILNLHLLERDYQQAFLQLDRILALLPHPDIEPRLYTKTLMGIGYFHNKLGAYRQALEYLGQLTNRHLTSRQQCLVFAHKLDALIGLNQTSPDDILYHATVAHCRNISEHIIVEGVLADMAQLQLRKGNYTWVINTLEPQLSQVEKHDYPMNMAEFYAHLAVSYYHTDNHHKAWFYGTKAMSYSPSLKINPSLYQTAKIMALLAKSFGTPEQTYTYLADALERQKNSFIQKRAQESVRKNLEFELEKNKALFAELSRLLAKQKSQLRIVNQEINTLDNQNLVSLGYIALAIIIVLGLGMSVFGIRKSRNALRAKLQLDPLTQVYDRSHLVKIFSAKWQVIQSQEQQTACLFCLQLNQLSDINYRNGHNLADWLIEKTAQILRNNAPHTSLIGRYKGSMLVMLLPSTDMHRLLQIHSRIIAQIDALNPSIFLTYKFPYHTTSMLVDLAGRKENMYGLLADCESKMRLQKAINGHKLIVEDSPNKDVSATQVAVDATNGLERNRVRTPE
ncbi:tetratricopeptide repeat-containing diguanylate cyclase [Thalassotalea litorea]|uniref:tetratricopeptide repeat-containing diguanylate cyclase n=1 Tax=Thalassotalea litorea TaxID=2020715 RepID=UPI003736B550